MKVTIEHKGFHGLTKCTITVKGKPGDRVELSPYHIERLHSSACGKRRCKCGETMLDACETRNITGNWQAWLTIPKDGKMKVDSLRKPKKEK